MKLLYTRQAADELEGIIDYIRSRSPSGARRVRARIRTVSVHLLDFPYAGALTTSGIRRVAVAPFPYLIFYEIRGDDVVVIGVRHSARDPSSMPGN